jgi:hypothetical protein
VLKKYVVVLSLIVPFHILGTYDFFNVIASVFAGTPPNAAVIVSGLSPPRGL